MRIIFCRKQFAGSPVLLNNGSPELRLERTVIAVPERLVTARQNRVTSAFSNSLNLTEVALAQGIVSNRT